MSEGAILVPGVWGPLWSAVIPGYWAAEGGQSAAGKLVNLTSTILAIYYYYSSIVCTNNDNNNTCNNNFMFRR